jgi:hypothetical protein
MNHDTCSAGQPGQSKLQLERPLDAVDPMGKKKGPTQRPTIVEARHAAGNIILFTRP